MGGSKRKEDNEVSFKRKKMKTKKESDSMDPVPHIEEANSESHTAELLSIQAIREGMLILGCVTDVKATSATVSLPGYLTGIIPAINISNVFTKHLTSFTDGSDADDIEPSMEAVLKVGMVIPCKVMEIMKDVPKGKPCITLSINPQDVNSELKPSSLYPKMVLFVSVCSVEDHGYIVDVGSRSIQGFLPKTHTEEDYEEIRIGSVIPTYVKQIIVRDKLSARIQLAKLDFTEEFPETGAVVCGNGKLGFKKFTGTEIMLQSLLPGTRIEVDVIEIQHPFVFMKFLSFDACASLLSIDRSHRNVKVGTTMKGTVLFVHPITRMIHVMLGPRPTPQILKTYFGLKRFQVVNNVKFQSVYKNRVYYKIKKGIYGFISTKDLPDQGRDSSAVSGDMPKACVVRFHYLDNLAQMSAQKSLLEQKFVLPEDVKIGEKYECVVKNHVQDGMLVSVCPGLSGFVRRIHMCDAFVTKPESLYPTGSKVKCRVVSSDGCGKVTLTCRESLLNLQDQYILTSYADAQRDRVYTGVVVKKTRDYILVLFFNDIKGIISADTIPKGSVFYEGLIIMCRVISCNPSKSRLKLSLEISDDPSLWNDMHSTTDEQAASAKNKTDSKKAKEVETVSKKWCTAIKKFCDTVEPDGPKPLEAIIKKVKGSQLNITVKDAKGRVHITQLGCTAEGVYPLKEFSLGQKISVYVIGEYKNKRFLQITSRNKFSKECSLTSPPVSSQLLQPGTSVIGFVKEVKDVSAIIWLSPTETGVLDYLHFSKNPKVVKKVRRYLKAGLSIKVSILADEKPTKRRKSSQGFALTKIEKSLPEVGKNILGLVQIGCIARGLILQLPFGYHGVAALTDLTDVYEPIQSLFDKCQKLKFVLCHVLEVNHETKYCQVSLRKSRVYNKRMTCADSFCPEILSSNVKEGDTVKGFVTSVSSAALNVVFGRNLEGKVPFHSCSLPGCTECIAADKIRTKYPTGSIVKVDVEEIGTGGKSATLRLTDSRNRINSKNNRLNIAEDILWDDVDFGS